MRDHLTCGPVPVRELRGVRGGIAVNSSELTFRSLLFGVQDLARSVTFYRNVINLREVLRNQDTAVMAFDEIGTRTLYLRQVDNVVHRRPTIGIQGLVCRVDSPQELDEIEENLLSHSEFVARSQLTRSIELVHGRDPDRIPLAFLVHEGDEKLTPQEYLLITERMYGFVNT